MRSKSSCIPVRIIIIAFMIWLTVVQSCFHVSAFAVEQRNGSLYHFAEENAERSVYIKKAGSVDNFLNGYINASGGINPSTKTIVNARPYNCEYDHLKKIKANNGYEFVLYVYSKGNSFLGYLHADGSIAIGGDPKKITEVNLQDYSDKLIRIGVNHKVDGSFVDISPVEAANLTFLYDAETALTFRDRRVSVIGDSISTFTGYTSPGAPAAYYPNRASGITNVSQMYWAALAERNNMVIDTIDAYGGATVGTKWAADLVRTPFIDPSRISRLGTPDIIIVEGGINDFGGNPLGEYPVDGNYSNLYEFRVAYGYLLNQLKQTYPTAKIVCLSLLSPKTYNNTQFPEKQTIIKQALATDITPHYLSEFNESIQELTRRYECVFCDVSDIVNYYNDMSNPLGPHPNSIEHLALANRIEQSLRDYCA